MNSLFKILLAFFLCITYSLSFYGQTENQVIIKGKQIINSLDLSDKIDHAVEEFIAGDDWKLQPDKSVQNFTVTYAKDWMKMDTVFTTDAFYDIQNEEKKASVHLYFGSGTTGLVMDIYVQMGDNDEKLTKIASSDVPIKETFTVSKQLINLLQTGGVAGKSWKGHPTISYKYNGKTLTDSPLVEKSETKKGDTIVKFFKEEKSSVQLAQGVKGHDVLAAFYGKLIDGGYDIGGSNEGSLLSAMGYLLSEGVPVEISEKTDILISSGEDTKTISTHSVDVTVFSIETKEVEVSESLKSAEEISSKKANNSSKSDKPKGCDCSCEKYKQLMAMSKKKKKDIDPSKMPDIDMNCIKKCAMEWAKCAQK